MKCQNLILTKNKKNVISLSSAEIVHSMILLRLVLITISEQVKSEC